MSFVSSPKECRCRKRIKRKLSFDILSGGRHFVVRREGVAIGTVRARDIQDLRVAKRLLQALADSVVVVLRLDYSDRNARLLIKDIVRKFLLLLVAACNVSANDHRPGVSVTSRRIWVIGSHPAPLIAGEIKRSQMSLSLRFFLSIVVKFPPKGR